jgi:hypothetical protein
LIALFEGDGVRIVTSRDQRIVGQVDPIGEITGQKEQLPLLLGAVGKEFVDHQEATRRGLRASPLADLRYQ